MTRTSSRIVRMVLAISIATGALAALAPDALASGPPTKRAHLYARPASGTAGAMVRLKGRGFVPTIPVSIRFEDGNGIRDLGTTLADARGRIDQIACVPWNARAGKDTFVAESAGELALAQAPFVVTVPSPLAGRLRSVRAASTNGSSVQSVCV